jgi:hypothetical protein
MCAADPTPSRAAAQRGNFFQELDPNGERIDNPSRAGQAGDDDGAAEAGLDQ